MASDLQRLFRRMSKKSKKQRAKERKAELVRRESGVTLRAVTPPPSVGAKVLELKLAKTAEAKPSEPVVEEQEPTTISAPEAAPPEEDLARREATAPAKLGADEPPEKVGEDTDAEAPAKVETPAADAEAPAKVETPAAGAVPAAPAAHAPAEPPEEHRASPRVSVAVDIHLSSDSHFFSGLSGDISEGGLFFSTYRPLTVGTQVDVEFSLPGTDRPVHARGEVRWIREHSADQPRGVGIAFEDLSDEDRDEIHEFCSSRPPLYYEDVG